MTATLVLDTSQMTIYELRDAIKQRLLGNRSGSMSVLIQSFGFKRGVPTDADLVFDVRMLPNPHWVKELRLKTVPTRPCGNFSKPSHMTGRALRGYPCDSWTPGCRATATVTAAT